MFPVNRACAGVAMALSRRSLSFASISLLCMTAYAEVGFSRPLGYSYRGQHEPRREEKIEVKKPVGPLFAVVSLADQHVSFYDANGLYTRSIISTGVPGHLTPEGVFTIMQKERWHRSNLYSGAPMPYMQRITWTGVAMHEGYVTGHPASHGCIRLPGDFAKRLFSITTPGQRVIISSQDVAPVDIDNPHLPKPVLRPLPALAEAGGSGDLDGSRLLAPVVLGTSQGPAAGTGGGKPLNPMEIARALKSEADAKALAAAKAKRTAAPLLQAALQKSRAVSQDLKSAEDGLRKAQDELEAATRDAAKGQGDSAIQQAAEKKAAAEAKVALAESRLQAARDADAANGQEIRTLEQTIRTADAAAAAAAESAKEAARRLEPVSIFISGKTGHLYVRQAMLHVFDAPVVVRDPGKPLGTHLFIATKPGDDGASLKWVALTPPAAAEVKVKSVYIRGRGRVVTEENLFPSSRFPETASGALDRIEIPEDAAQRISELLWTGATLIVSDVEMSGEGRYPMDFMILNRTVVR